MERGNDLMKIKSFELPPVESHQDGLPIYFLTGKNHFYQTLFCIQSLDKNSTQKFRYTLVDDGSFNESLIEQLKRKLPNVRIVGMDEINQNVERHLPEEDYPKLRYKRIEYPHIRKLTDIHTIDGDDWKIVFDSDMLFWSAPNEIIDWIRNPTMPIHMIDCVEAYGYSLTLMEELAKEKIKKRLNVGVIGLNSKAINWNKLESWTENMESREGKSYYLEQALSAMLIGSQYSLALNSESYIVNPQPTDKGILHHYVDYSKKTYQTEKWIKILE
ncbi:MAG: glycosyl transferase [Pedobacter sp.]|nr:MAG: glycosyl transferase [Pedobacter sp.]